MKRTRIDTTGICDCSRLCDLRASRWTLPWHVADCFMPADHRHVPGKAPAHCPWLETGRWPQAHKTVSSCTPGQRGDSRQHAKCRGVTGDQRAPSAPPEPAQCHKCRTCHANRRWMSPSAKQSDGGCRQAPRLPHKVPRRHRRPTGPATQNEA